MAFTTLMLGQLFNVFNARSERRSAFRGVFSNPWLWAAVGLSVVMQFAVIYAPFLQRAFSTTGLTGMDWVKCTAVASTVLWAGEARKVAGSLRRRSA
jgi:Ca2+-transporting ATPase